MFRLGLVLAALQLAGAAEVSAAALDDLAGSWRGVVERHDPGMEPPPGDVVLVVRPGSGRFALSWTVPGKGIAETTFAADDTPGVYSVVTSGLFAMFGRRGGGNPLADGQLLWARTDEAGLYVYSLTIDRTGRYRLDRLSCHPQGQTVQMTLVRRSTGEPERTMVANLQRAGS
jgi:hypothetical protein